MKFIHLELSNLIGQFELTMATDIYIYVYLILITRVKCIQYITLLTVISGVSATISLLLKFVLVW